MSDLPGFSAEQAWTIETVAQRAAERAVAELRNQPCTAPCARVDDLEDTVYGNGTPGLKTSVTQLQKDVESLVWWFRLVAGAVVVALVSGAVALLK